MGPIPPRRVWRFALSVYPDAVGRGIPDGFAGGAPSGRPGRTYREARPAPILSARPMECGGLTPLCLSHICLPAARRPAVAGRAVDSQAR